MNSFMFGKCVIVAVKKTEKFYVAQAFSKMRNQQGALENIFLNIFITPEVMEWENMKGEKPKLEMVQKDKSVCVSGVAVHDINEKNALRFNVLVNRRQGIEFPKKNFESVVKLLDADIVSDAKQIGAVTEILGQYNNNGKMYNVILSYKGNETSAIIKKGKSANFSGFASVRRNTKGVPYLVINAETAVADRKVNEKYVNLDMRGGKEDETI